MLPELQLWLVDHLTVLAEAIGEPVTAERLKIYSGDLLDIPREQMAIAFQRARQGLKFFPKIAELRELAGACKLEKQEDIAANAAWDDVQEYLRKWGVNGMPVFAGGKEYRPPALEPRTEYALRACGGLARINAATDTNFSFVKKEFLEAWLRAEHVQQFQTTRALAAGAPVAAIAGLAGYLAGGKMETGPERTRGPQTTQREIPRPPSEAELLKRRDELQKQAQDLGEQKKAAPVA
jgi:hypothetical protein